MAMSDGFISLRPNRSLADDSGYASVESKGDTDSTNPRLVNGVIVLLLLLLNLSGNSLVCYIYRYRIKASVFSFFVTILALLDLSTALTTMVIDVILKMRRESESTLNLAAMCKLSHFQVYGSSLIGGFVFVLIAYQRYRKICHPLKPSLNMRQARLYVLVIGLVCTVLSVPTLIINGAAKISVSVNGHVVRTTVCRYDEQFKGTITQVCFSYLLLSAFAVIITTTVTFYVLIFRALRTFERGSSIYSATGPASPGTPLPDIGSVHSHESTSPQPQEGGADPMRISRLNNELSPSPGRNAQPKWPQGGVGSSRRPRGSRQLHPRFSVVTMTEGRGERVSSQMHRVFTVVTAVFVISYLPHLVTLILTKSLNLDERTLTWTQRFLLEVAYNCPYISTVANPFVYGFRSSEFRRQCKKLLSCSKSGQARSSKKGNAGKAGRGGRR
ncbi:orexin receptor type 2 [Plakobranchus ocellatus]|uniref:Orexin receptor type 2 n=1 Tax=Plakobranchus ocellatus TaxID=259542 RepID=A0AAV3ZLA6_9GAST|nr:orexin receptor type 2 [Plakobranchus ocellatus]